MSPPLWSGEKLAWTIREWGSEFPCMRGRAVEVYRDLDEGKLFSFTGCIECGLASSGVETGKQEH